MRYSLIVRVIGVVFCILLGASLVVYTWKNKRIDKSLGFNAIVLGETQTTVMSYKPESLSVDYVDIPNDLKISLSTNGSSFGVKELREIVRENQTGVTLDDFRRGLSLELGIPIPVIIQHRGKNELISLRDSLINWRGVKSNLGILDRLEIIRLLGVVLAKGLNLSQPFPLKLTDRIVEVDGKTYQKVNESVYSWSRNYFLSEAVLSETAEIVVINASGVGGTGRKVSKQLETAGMRVIEVKGEESVLDRVCEVSGDYSLHPMTVRYLVNYFGCETVGNVSKTQGADLTVLLGKKY